MQKYVLVNNHKKDISKLNEWFKFCENNDLPYIFVERYGKYWKVEYDLIALVDKYGHNFQLDDSVKKEVTALFKKYLEPYEDYLIKYNRKKLYEYYKRAEIVFNLEIGRFKVHVGNICGYIKGLTKEEAVSLAERLYALLSNYILNNLPKKDIVGGVR